MQRNHPTTPEKPQTASTMELRPDVADVRAGSGVGAAAGVL